MAAAMDGLDALAFTGGVGEHAPTIRARAATGLDFLGIGLDEQRNAEAPLDAEIGSATAPVRCFAVRAREDIQIARDARGVLTARPSPATT